MNEESLFAAALEKPSGQERQAFLDAACAGDAALRERLERLLAADERATGILEHGSESATTTRSVPLLSANDLFAGRYQLREKLGEGGMGEVWVAEQIDPVKRRVALKVIRPGLVSDRILVRFETERQALALMDHPNIAKFLDAGITNGRPYFVMELIKGVPITRYCDEARMEPRTRIELFVHVCRAIQHAHQKGVIHRDLKPSNILVTESDGRPIAKVIDFGVAKATGPRLSVHSAFTEVGAIIGTLEYMSPEQAELNNQDIDTRTDIYALGAVLYELLTGVVPFPRRRLLDAGLAEMLRIIKEVDPPSPSARLSDTETGPGVAAQRRTEPRRLAALVRGELDWIVMKALAKDRNRRYESPVGLAHDLERYLADEPVSAGPPSVMYRLRKFARRHRVLFATAAAFVGVLVAATVLASVLAVRAKRAEEAEAGHRQIAEHNEQAAKQERNKAVEAGEKTIAALKEERFTSYLHRVARAHREWLAGEVDSARQILEECPPDLREWEWRYVRRLCNSELIAYRAHAAEVFSAVFSPDGLRVASVGRTEVRVWDAATGKDVFRISEPDQTGMAVAFRPDGKRLAVAWKNRVTIHDATDGKHLFRIDVHGKSASAANLLPGFTGVAYSPDGKRLATTYSAGARLQQRGEEPAEVRVWDSNDGKELHRFVDPPRPLPRIPTGLAFSPNGKYLAVSLQGGGTRDAIDPGELIIRDAADGRVVHAFLWSAPVIGSPRSQSDYPTGLAFRQDSERVVASGSDGTVRAWELPAGRLVLTLQGRPQWGLSNVAFSPAGDRLAAAGSDRVVRIWDAVKGGEAETLAGHSGPVRTVAFSPDGRRLASTGSHEIRIWDTTAGQQARVWLAEPRTWWAERVSFSPDGRFLSLGSSDSLRIREVATGEERRFAGVSSRMMVFAPDGATVATTGGDGVTIWDVAKGRPVRLLPDPPKEPDLPYPRSGYLAFSADGRRLATVGNSLLTVWEAATGRLVRRFKLHPQYPLTIGGVSFSPDGRRVAVATQDQTRLRAPLTRPLPAEVRIWDVELGQELTPLSGGGGGVAYSPDGTRLLSGNTDGTVSVWDADSGIVVLTLRGHTGEVTDVSFSRDGRRLVTSGVDMTIRLWDPAAGKEVLVLRGHSGKVISVRLSPDGLFLVSLSLGGGDPIRIWDARPIDQ